MTDDDRKALTLYIGECWHEFERFVCDDSSAFDRCKKCKLPMRVCINRTFSTHDDLYAVFSKIALQWEWGKFDTFMLNKWYDQFPFQEWKMPYIQWLSCYGCPEQIGERMSMAAEFIRERGKG